MLRVRDASTLLTSLLFCSLALIPACGGNTSNRSARALSYGDTARRSYEHAFEAYEDEDCLTADPLFRRIRRDFPYSRYAALAELRIADCSLIQGHHTEAIRAYRSFLRARPAHPERPYASYKMAEAYYRQIPQDFFLSPPPEERDQQPTRRALRQLRRFLLDYPEDEHVERAREMVAECLRLLARHELYVADFYMNRDQYRAAIIRLRRLLSDFDGSGMEPEALILLGRTYLRMEEIRDARDTFNELLERFPDSGYAEQARSYLHEMGEEVPERPDREAGPERARPERARPERARPERARPERARPEGSPQETSAGAEEGEESEASEG